MAEKGAAAVAVKSVQETVPTPVKVSEPPGILERMNRVYDAIRAEPSKSSKPTEQFPAVILRTGSRPKPNCCIP